MNHIPMLDLKAEYLYMKQDIDRAIERCLGHQQWILGPEVKQLEDQISDYLNVKNCIGVSSGTDALVLALRALALKTKGQEYFDRSDSIMTTPFTFTATGDAILRAGATPVFVDIDPVTYNIDPIEIRSFLTQHSTPNAQHFKVVGLLPVHLYGQSCQMDEIMSIADEYRLWVVEDAAQAFGGSCGDRKLGAIGIAGCYSFFPSKNLGGYGDGGMVATNDGELSNAIRMLLKHGGKDKYNVDHIGYNARLDTLQAAILLAKLKYVDEFNARRRNLAAQYTQGLRGLESVVVPSQHSKLNVQNSSSLSSFEEETVFHQFTIRVTGGQRDALQAHLKSDGIDSMVYYPVPLHKMKVFDGRSLIAGKLDQAEKAAQQVLSLPINPLQQPSEAERVIESLRSFLPPASLEKSGQERTKTFISENRRQ